MSRTEIWKTVRGFKDYEVSNFGNVRKYLTKELISINTSSNGYKTVSLRKKKKDSRSILLHRIMAETFLPKIQVNHIDGDKTNNKLENLEWSNGSLNTKHAYSLGLAKKIIRNNKLGTFIDEIKNKYTGKRGDLTNLAKEYNCSVSAIYEIVHNKSWIE